MKKMTMEVMGMVLCLLFLSASGGLAQGPCEGNFDCDLDVDGSDAFIFKSDFGRSQFKNPCPPCDPPAQLPKTGQTGCWDTAGNLIACPGTGEDGELQKGVAVPNPRFTDNADGTVRDNLTGLIWLKNAHCFGTRTWAQALSDCNGLANGSCGLTDGSSTGDWRLPNRNELNSLIDVRFSSPALPNTAGTGQWTTGNPFTNVQSLFYWSSTTATTPNFTWLVSMNVGSIVADDKSLSNNVWPVRGNKAAIINVDNFRFDADNNDTTQIDTVNISVGDRVRWNWQAGIHTITSGVDLGDPNAGLLFDKPSDINNLSFSFTFTQAGTFPYFCRFHVALQNMKGIIEVH